MIPGTNELRAGRRTVSRPLDVRLREQKWLLVALGGSVLLHGAFTLWAGLHPVEPHAAHVVSAEFVFSEPDSPQVRAKLEPQPELERELEPAPPRSEPQPKPVRKVSTLPEARVIDAPKQIPPPTDVPAVTPPSVALELPRVRLSLLPGSSFALRLDAGVEDGPEVVMRTQGLHALEPPKDLVASLATETIGRGRVDRGLVHPYYSELGKTLLKQWDAERVAKSGLKGLVEQTSENVKLYNEIWADRAAAYGRSGNPLGDGASTGNRRAVVNDRIAGLPGVDLEQRKELQRQMREAYKATRRALIRVVQNASGHLTKVELVQPSNDSKVDKEALADVRAAAEKLPAPPPEALEGKPSLSSLWSFELVVSISPPVPTFTFEFDEALGFVDMRLPLDRRIYKKVRLVAVE